MWGYRTVVLKNHRNVAISRRESGYVALIDPNRSFSDFLEPGEHLEDCRLARP
jgi:hypothetical protein